MPVVKPRITIQEADGAPSGKPGTLKFPNGSLTDNGDGSFTYTAAAGGGQTLVDRIVATSGGDHTSLAAAITASSAGDTIFVRSGTYSESAITSSLANLTIIGENPETALISMGANALTFSGSKVRLINLGLTFTTSGVTLSGTYSELQGCIITATGNGQTLTLSGAQTAFRDSQFFDAVTGTTSTQRISCSGIESSVIDSYLEIHLSNAGQWLNLSGSSSSCIGNRFKGVNGLANANIIQGGASYVRVINNQIIDADNIATLFYAATQYYTVANNTMNGGLTLVNATDAANGVIVGNFQLTNHLSAAGIIAPRTVIAVGNRLGTTSGSGAGTGIALSTANASDSIVADNYLVGYATGISVGSSVTNATIVNNNLRGILTTPMTDAGTATNAHGNVGASILHELTTVRMKNTSGGTINAGDIVVLKAVAAGDEVTTTTTASDNQVFGVATAAISNNAYGYIQTAGKTTLLKVDGNTDIAVGDFITTFTTAGIGKKAATAVLGVTLGDLAIAIALEAYSTNDSNGVIDALIIQPRRL